MAYDFSNEQEQRQMNYGPVPAGSIVVLQMTLMRPHNPAPDNPAIVVTQSGLRQLYCQFEVAAGTYQGCQFRQSITLPCGMQKISLSPNTELACQIGGAMLKAVLLAAQKGTRIESFAIFNNLKFPARLKINNRPYEKDGREYWRNEIATVITPDKPEYQRIRREKEIINPNGAVAGQKKQGAQANGNVADLWADSYGQEPAYATDDVPF